MILFFDLETEPFARGYSAPLPVTASWSWDGAEPRVGLIAEFVPEFERALADPACLLVNQNIAFDMACMCTLDPSYLPRVFAAYAAGRVRCIMLQEKLIQIAVHGSTEKFYNLAALCEIHNLPAVNKDNHWRLKFASLRDVPVAMWPPSAIEYALGDADRPARIYAAQLAIAAEFQRRTGYAILHLSGYQAYKAFACFLIQAKGFNTHPERTLELKRLLDSALTTARRDLQEAGLVRPDGSKDTKAAAAYITRACQARGMDVRLTGTGRVCTSKEVLELIPDDLVTSYSLYSQAGTYAARVEDMCQGFELPLQCSFDTLLETDRTSTSKPAEDSVFVGTQPQNFPRKLLVGRGEKTAEYRTGKPIYAPVGARECVAPPPGHVFIVCDLPTAELRSVSQQCLEWFGRSHLAEAINAGKDVHHMLGGQMIGLPYEDMLRRASEPAIKDARDNAKPGNFGFWGGMKEKAFVSYAWKQAHRVFSLEQATALRSAWCASWPEHEPYFDLAKRVTNNGKVRSWFDAKTREWKEMTVALIQHPRTGFVRNNCPYTVFCNTHFQHRTAVGAALGLCEVQRRCFAVPTSALYGCWTIMYTHDEIVGVAPIERAPEAAVELGEVMRDQFNTLHELVPIRQLDPYVTTIYSKQAKAVTDANGRLVPWQPEGV